LGSLHSVGCVDGLIGRRAISLYNTSGIAGFLAQSGASQQANARIPMATSARRSVRHSASMWSSPGKVPTVAAASSDDIRLRDESEIVGESVEFTEKRAYVAEAEPL
jgi:hypothetical protein